VIYKSDYYVGSDLNGDSLSHHGVPNQRWGIKNGPPYPVQRISGKAATYSISKMTEKTKDDLRKKGKIPGVKDSLKKTGAAVKSGAKSAGTKVKSSFQRWKNNKKADLAIKETDNRLLKNWQKKQLRISDMTNQELQQRIDRKKLEESYKRALRGDFSDPKTWKKSSKDAKSGDGKKAAESILKKVGDAAVEGLAKGLSSKIEQTMTAKAKAKVARREARRDAIAEVMTDAAKERAQYRAEARNAQWRAKKERKEAAKQAANRRKYDQAVSKARGLSSGSSGGQNNSYYYMDPNDWTVY